MGQHDSFEKTPSSKPTEKEVLFQMSNDPLGSFKDKTLVRLDCSTSSFNLISDHFCYPLGQSTDFHVSNIYMEKSQIGVPPNLVSK